MFVKRLFRTLSIILIVLFFTGALPWRELRADANIHGDYTCDRLSVTYDQVSSWDLNTQGEFLITNTSEEIVEGWAIKFDFASDVTITNLWNGQDLRDETTPANTLIIGNEVYNATINPGESINFGLIMTGTEFAPVAPLNAELLIEEPAQEEVIVEPEIVVEEQTAADPSTCVIFAGSDITISGYRTTIHGDIYSGSNFNYQGSELSVDGIVRSEGNVNVSGYSSVITGTEENAIHVDMPDLSEDILTRENCFYSEEYIDISTQTIEGENVIVSEGDITINVDTISEDSNIILYSVNGNITINGNRAVLNGTIYAPNGRVTINANEITLAGKILANEFVFNGSVLTVTNDPEEIPEITPEPTVTVVPTSVPTVTVTPTGVPTVTPTVTVTPTDAPTATPTEIATPTPVEEDEPTPTPTPEPIDETMDSDGDYIPDYMEDEIGTNPNDPDSDGDGLDDYLELMIGYDPTRQDTDNNGILDGEEDLDNDGLCNINELSLETDFFSEDTDGDRLKDGEEYYTYGIDPKNPDSDNDGILDGDEIDLGKDPTDSSDATIRIEQTKIQEITNEEDPAITSVEVTMNLANSIDQSLRISDMYNVDKRTTNVPGRIGSPLSFECEEDFDTATVVIHYSEAALGDTAESDLGIIWYDEDNGVFVEQEQATLDSSNNKITVELEHFSQYVLVNLRTYRAALPPVYQVDEQYVADEVHYNVMFAIDLSSSMDTAERQEVIDTINTMLGYLEEGDRVSFCAENNGYFSFTNYADASRVTSLSSSWERTILTQTYNGQANMATYTSAAADIFYRSGLTDSDTNTNIIIFITDENSTYNVAYNGMHVLGPLNNYYGLFVGNSYNQTIVNACSNLRGWSCQASSSIVRQIILHGGNGNSVWTDDDEDGLPDVVEEDGMLGLDGHFYYSRTDSDDSDYDTLSDGAEMGTMYSVRRADEEHVQICGTYMAIDEVGTSSYSNVERFIPENPGEICFVFDVQSDPSDSDSDDDYYKDDVDPNRMRSDIEVIGLGGSSYTLRMNDNNGYIHVQNVPGNTSRSYYGGNQGWFTEETVTGSDILRNGCGLIAVNDVMLYMSHGVSTFDWNEYHDYVIETDTDFYDMQSFFQIRIPNSYSWSFSYVRRCLSYNGFENTLYDVDVSNPDCIIESIEESLRADKPIILMESDWLLIYEEHLNENRVDPVDIVQREGYPLYRNTMSDSMTNMFSPTQERMTYHYVTITGMLIDNNLEVEEDSLVSEINQKVYFRVQSWGEEYYIKYSDFLEYNYIYGDAYGYVIVID